MIAENSLLAMTPPVQVTFTVYPRGLDAPYSRRLNARLRHHGIAIRWVRRNLRSALPILDEVERGKLDLWLNSASETEAARRAIGRGERFEYVTDGEGLRIEAIAQHVPRRP